jgi:dihydroorotate dehydrogenase
MYDHLRRALFALPTELSHWVSLTGIAAAARLGISERFIHPLYHPTVVMGLKFRNRVGLAAGLDKDARCVEGLFKLGFGFIEVGTVTPLAQPGNPKPRLFRLEQHGALINRMGFNNAGAQRMRARLDKVRAGLSAPGLVLGVNIGKNKSTPNERAVDDYLACLEILQPVADYITVNVSSPNTPGLRELQTADVMRDLLGAVKGRARELDAAGERRVPIVAKIAPDLSDAALEALADVLVEAGIDGVVATNTTIDRSGVVGHRFADEAGGLSGRPLAPRSQHVVRVLCRALAGRLPVIGVGGIHDVASALAMVEAGAALVQLYTGFIYAGPNLVRDVARVLGAGTDGHL